MVIFFYYYDMLRTISKRRICCILQCFLFVYNFCIYFSIEETKCVGRTRKIIYMKIEIFKQYGYKKKWSTKYRQEDFICGKITFS